ncbi:MAG: ERCC4 domain-containing protein [Hydrogenophaga sp.]|nr:ERCC4 domain-containing protein [Hydrogenophaga sp.]
MSRAVPPTASRLIVRRDGKAITGKVPKPVILTDTREQSPLDLARFKNWIAGQRVATLPTGDYTVEGMEGVVCMERKSLPDLVGTLMHNRQRFFREMERMQEFQYRCILVEASYEDVKSPYSFTTDVQAHPNGVSGSLDALEVKFGVPIIYSSQNRDLVEEKAASWLSKTFTYWWLETNGLGRVLQDGDL